MDSAKYVVIHERMCDGRGRPIEDEKGFFIDRDVLYVFPPIIIHRDFANKISMHEDRWVGAGFVGKQSDGKHFCYGKSESMEVSSRAEDTVLLKIMLGE